MSNKPQLPPDFEMSVEDEKVAPSLRKADRVFKEECRRIIFSGCRTENDVLCICETRNVITRGSIDTTLEMQL